MKIVKRIGTIIVSIVLWAVILLAALYAVTILTNKQDGNVSSVAGFTPMIVQTNSMAPTFYSGDMIFVKKCDTSKLEVGDIITFHTIIENEYALNTHRIESIEEVDSVRSYTTKGDNNGIADTHVISDGDIVGKYVGHVSKLGKVMDILSSSVGFMLIIVVPMLIFFIYQVYHLIMVSINLKKAVALEAAEAQASVQTGSEEAAKAKKEAEEMLAEAQRLREEAEALKANASKSPEKTAVAEEEADTVKGQTEDETSDGK